jgi:hypothetical protein
MKTCISLFLALGSLGLAITLAAAPEPRARGYRVVAIETLNCPTIEVGTPDYTVRRILGEPARRLDAATWVYPQYCALPYQEPDDDRRTMVISFEAGKVSDLKLVNDRAEKVIAAARQSKPAAKELLAAK